MNARLVLLAVAACGGGAASKPVAPMGSPTQPVSPYPVVPVADPPVTDARAERIEMTFMGDVMFGGTFSGRFVPQEAGDFDPAAAVAELVKSDLALANLETTVVKDIPVTRMKGNLRFAARPDQVAALPRNGIKHVTLANNHANDLDGAGVAETPIHLAELGITFIGGAVLKPPAFRAETIEVKGWRVGFVAATTKLNRPQKPGDPVVPMVDIANLEAMLVPIIAAARKDHDLVLVILHWGTQYDEVPSAEQVKAARAFIDAGAGAVIGHHPHILQGVERYRDGLIAYSLGNFLFQNAVKGQRDTGVLRLGFRRDGGCIDLVAFQPAVMQPQPVHHPIPAAGAAFKEIAAKVRRLSKPFATTWTLETDRLVSAPFCR